MSDDRLQSTLVRLADVEPSTDGVSDRVQRIRRQRRNRRRAAVTGAAVVPLIAVGLVVVTDDDADQPAEVVAAGGEDDSGEDVPAQADLPATREVLTELDPGPLSTRHESAVIAVGDRIIVWGGDIEGSNVGRPELGTEQFNDGAVYDLNTGDWSMMAPSPLPGGDGVPVAAWTGDEVVFVQGEAAAAWDPVSDAWRELPDAPEPIERGWWTGSELLALGPADAVALTDGEWRRLADPPIDDDRLWRWDADWTGDQLVLVEAPTTAGSMLTATAYDPATDVWTDLPPVDIGVNVSAVGATWTGEELVVVADTMSVRAFEPTTETWRRLPDLPIRVSKSTPRPAIVDDTLVVFHNPGVAVARDDGWLVLPAQGGLPELSQPTPTVDGAAGFAMGRGGDNRFAIFRPVVGPTQPDAVQIDLAVLELSEDQSISPMLRDVDDAGAVATTTTELTTPGGSCVLTVDEPLIGAAPIVEDDFEIIEVDERNALVHVRLANPIMVACDTPGLAREVARQLHPLV